MYRIGSSFYSTAQIWTQYIKPQTSKVSTLGFKTLTKAGIDLLTQNDATYNLYQNYGIRLPLPTNIDNELKFSRSKILLNRVEDLNKNNKKEEAKIVLLECENLINSIQLKSCNGVLFLNLCLEIAEKAHKLELHSLKDGLIEKTFDFTNKETFTAPIVKIRSLCVLAESCLKINDSPKALECLEAAEKVIKEQKTLGESSQLAYTLLAKTYLSFGTILGKAFELADTPEITALMSALIEESPAALESMPLSDIPEYVKNLIIIQEALSMDSNPEEFVFEMPLMTRLNKTLNDLCTLEKEKRSTEFIKDVLDSALSFEAFGNIDEAHKAKSLLENLNQL